MNFVLCVTSITYVAQSIISIFLLMSANFYFQLMVTQSKFCKSNFGNVCYGCGLSKVKSQF